MKKAIVLLFVTCCFSWGCKNQLKVVREVTNAMEIFSNEVRINSGVTFDAGMISRKDYDQILEICNAADESRDNIRAIVNDLQTLNPESREELRQVVMTLYYHLYPDRWEFLDTIGDEKLRKGLILSFTVIRTALISANYYLLFSTEEN